MSTEAEDRLVLFRGVISALVGAFLVVYGVVSARPDKLVIVALGLVLLGVLALSAILPSAMKHKGREE